MDDASLFEGLLEHLDVSSGVPNACTDRLIHPSAWRDCLKIPDKPHCGLSRVLRTQPGTPFHRLACHQTQRLRTPLAIFQTVSLRTRVNKSEERKGRGTTPRPLLRCWGALGRLHTVAVGLMFWFTRKRLVGSYSFFMSTKRSKSSR